MIYTIYNTYNTAHLILRPNLMSDDVFGKNYIGSNLYRKNQRKRKQIAKMNRRK